MFKILAVSAVFMSVSFLAQAQADTVKKRYELPKHVKYIIPAGFLAYGFVAQEFKALNRVDLNIRGDFTEDFPGFQNHLDDGLQYLPVAAVYVLGLSGVRGKNNLVDKTAMFLVSNTVMSMSVAFLKTKVGRLRPDGSDNRSFPSGHTATAFSSAELMAQEYKDVSPWYGIGAYAVATATGSMRMLNNKHWLSDVVAGAGIGILSTKLAYFVYPLVKNALLGTEKTGMGFMPGYQQGLATFNFTASF